MRLLLVHGLGRTAFSLARLGRRLQREGHQPAFFSYWAFAESYGRIVARLTERIQQLAAGTGPIGLIGHSLGGLMLRHALSAALPLPDTRLIMLGTPNQPPRMAARASRWFPWRVFTGSCGALLASSNGYGQIPVPPIAYTIISGTAGAMGKHSRFAGELNDGFVAVSETLVSPLDHPVLFPVFHTFMMNNPGVQDAILRALNAPASG